MSWIVEWLELAVRWLHVIAGISWIGTSFYFNWLNDSFDTPERPEKGVSGELWSVHGGGFYRVSKYEVAPERMPRTLHWFKWEAYTTWISGFALLVLIYYLGADVYLLDPTVASISAWVAIVLGIGTLVVGWLIYDRLCRTGLAGRSGAFAILGIVLVAGVAYALTHLFGSRAAYIHVGAMLGTIMAANVFFVIIPSQKRMVAAIERGEEPDAAAGKHAAMRSRHNNYLTLPVVFVMISSHYPTTYTHAYNWLILLVLFVIGATTRHYFNLRHQGREKAWLLPAAALALIVLAYAVSSPRLAPGSGLDVSRAGEEVTFETVRTIIVARCSSCHSAAPSHPLFNAPPGGIVFDTPAEIRQRIDRIRAVTVETKAMPLGNFTEMTDEERAQLGRWIEQGGRID